MKTRFILHLQPPGKYNFWRHFVFLLTLLLIHLGGLMAQPAGAPLPNVADAATAWADVDGDSDLDLFLAGVDSANHSVTELFINGGASGFVASGFGFPLLRFAACAFGDFDIDGDPDLAICGYGNGNMPQTFIYQNDAGIFNQLPGSFTGLASAAFAWADLDMDSDLDLFGTGRTGGDETVVIWRNNFITGSILPLGPVTFTETSPLGITPVAAATVRLEDFTGDGIPDVMLRGGRDIPAPVMPGKTGEEFSVKLYRNLTGFSFGELTTAFSTDTLTLGSMDTRDFTGDGTPDIFLTGADGWVGTRLLQKSGSSWTAVSSSLPDIAVGDLKGANLSLIHI